MLVACLTSCWAADQASARKAVDTYLPDAATPLKEGIVASLAALPEGSELKVTLAGRTSTFAVVFGQVLGREGQREGPTQTPAAEPASMVQPASGLPKPGADKPWELTPSALGWGLDDRPYPPLPGAEITGPDGGRYVWVPPGEFMMGSDEGSPHEGPVHTVRVTKGFWLAKCPVTVSQYRAFCEATGHKLWPENTRPGDAYPVTTVTWHDAEAYCSFYGARLPTEAQWEYAARGPESRIWPWGNEWHGFKCCHIRNQSPDHKLFPVGSFPADVSWCGALDMAGNVWQWCADWYAEDYYMTSPAADPEGPGEGAKRVHRGGSFWMDHNGCQSFRRWPDVPLLTGEGLGFRCAITPK